MPGKPQPLLVEPSDFAVYLKARMIVQNQNVSQLAESIGVSSPVAYQLLSGEISPSEDILKKVGLRTVYIADETARASVVKAKK